MNIISLSIQNGWLTRFGMRGKWITAYKHIYNGGEVTERFHSHPWLIAFGVVISGWVLEQFPGSKPFMRRRFSIKFYGRKTKHRVVDGHGRSLFFGFFRAQTPIPQAAEFRTWEGYCHYTELMPGERGFRADMVSLA